MSETVSREGRAIQECPICGAAQPLSARNCSICGAVLPGERTPIVSNASIANEEKTANRSRYDPALGDDDLYAGDLSGRMWRLLLVGGILLALVVGVGAGVVIGQMGDDDDPPTGDGANVQVEDLTPRAGETLLPSLTPEGGVSGSATVPPTATPRAPSADLTQTAQSFNTLPTVTPLPPSATPTPTPGPCMQTASSNDTVLGMAMRCGHKDMSVIDLILEVNDMDSPEELQLGQTLEIPWPTPTAGPPTEAPAEATPEDSAAAGQANANAGETVNTAAADTSRDMEYNEFGTPDALAYYKNLEPTLRPGLAWHTVVAGETIMGVAYQYETSVETLSQINPEIPFRQCDYGMRYGGENCSVMLIEGQQVRVPVPIPTSTPMPTPDGPLTPTPSPTATYNAPYTLKPEDGAAFMADEIVTLRWGSTGTLGADERYVVRVRDLEGYEQHIAFASETSYQLPGGWQPGDGQRHTFEWTIAVAEVDDDLNITNEHHETELRHFTWESR